MSEGLQDLKRGFPWPGSGQREAAAAALAAERERRTQYERRIADELGVPGREPRPITDDEAVLIVLWSLRGDR